MCLLAAYLVLGCTGLSTDVGASMPSTTGAGWPSFPAYYFASLCMAPVLLYIALDAYAARVVRASAADVRARPLAMSRTGLPHWSTSAIVPETGLRCVLGPPAPLSWWSFVQGTRTPRLPRRTRA